MINFSGGSHTQTKTNVRGVNVNAPYTRSIASVASLRQTDACVTATGGNPHSLCGRLYYLAINPHIVDR